MALRKRMEGGGNKGRQEIKGRVLQGHREERRRGRDEGRAERWRGRAESLLEDLSVSPLGVFVQTTLMKETKTG